jgi:hypothetical protein
MRVWVDSWQMQCCGKPFRVGGRVSWTLGEADPDWLAEILGEDPGMDATEQHHGGIPGTVPSAGTVTRIEAVYCRLAPEPGSGSGTAYPVAGSGTRAAVESADGWTADRGDEHFIGYLVQLDVT